MDSTLEYVKIAKRGKYSTFLVLAAVLVIRFICVNGVPML
jgi:hypothetical protein